MIPALTIYTAGATIVAALEFRNYRQGWYGSRTDWPGAVLWGLSMGALWPALVGALGVLGLLNLRCKETR